MKAVVQGTEQEGYIGEPDPLLLQMVTDDVAPLRPSRPEAFHRRPESPALLLPTSVGSRDELLLELALIKAAVRGWWQKQPDQVIREASAYSARLTELWTELRLLEQYNREYTQLRTMQVQPVLEEVDRQYKFAQSRIAMARQDIDLLRGGA